MFGITEDKTVHDQSMFQLDGSEKARLIQMRMRKESQPERSSAASHLMELSLGRRLSNRRASVHWFMRGAAHAQTHYDHVNDSPYNSILRQMAAYNLAAVEYSWYNACNQVGGSNAYWVDPAKPPEHAAIGQYEHQLDFSHCLEIKGEEFPAVIAPLDVDGPLLKIEAAFSPMKLLPDFQMQAALNDSHPAQEQLQLSSEELQIESQEKHDEPHEFKVKAVTGHNIAHFRSKELIRREMTGLTHYRSFAG